MSALKVLKDFRAVWICAALALAACGPQSAPPTPTPTPMPPNAPPPPLSTPAVTAAPEVSAPPPSVRLAPTNPELERWKRAAAERIHETSGKELASGRPQPMLRAIIVIQIAVDERGRIKQARVLRSPGSPALEAKALHSLRRAAPLPLPPPALLKKGRLAYSETWLFNTDGRFQLRSLALPQD